MAARTFLAALVLASSALARTDLEGCTAYRYVVTPSHGPAYQTGVHYVPDTGEICAFLDCGGGRAPPKTDVPGCPLYEGTQSYEPSFLDLATVPGAAVPPASTTVAVTEATAEATTEATTEETSVLETTSVEEGEETTMTTPPASVVTADAPDVTTSTSGAASATAASEDVVSTTPGSGALPTAAAVLAPCLVAGAVAGWGML